MSIYKSTCKIYPLFVRDFPHSNNSWIFTAEPEEEEEEEESENEESSSGGENDLTYETAESANTTVREATSVTSDERPFSVITSAASKPQNDLADDNDSQSVPTSDANETTASDYTLAKSQDEDSSVSEPVEKSDETKETPQEEPIHSPAEQQEQAMPEQDDISQEQDTPKQYNNESETLEENQFVKEPSPDVLDKSEPPSETEPVVEQTESEEPSKDVSEITHITENSEISSISKVHDDTFPDESSMDQSLETTEILNSTEKPEDLNESLEQSKSITNEDSQIFDDHEKTLPRTESDQVEKMETDDTPEVIEQNEEAKKPEQVILTK